MSVMGRKRSSTGGMNDGGIFALAPVSRPSANGQKRTQGRASDMRPTRSLPTAIKASASGRLFPEHAYICFPPIADQNQFPLASVFLAVACPGRMLGESMTMTIYAEAECATCFAIQPKNEMRQDVVSASERVKASVRAPPPAPRPIIPCPMAVHGRPGCGRGRANPLGAIPTSASTWRLSVCGCAKAARREKRLVASDEARASVCPRRGRRTCVHADGRLLSAR